MRKVKEIKNKVTSIGNTYMKKGEIYNKLTAEFYCYHEHNNNDINSNRYSVWQFRCECGNIVRRRESNVKNGHTKSCGCAHNDVIRNDIFLGDGVAPFNQLFKQYKCSAKSRNLDFNLTKIEFKNLTEQNCYYCDRPPSQIKKVRSKKSTYTYNGVDRINNSLGYETSNCVPCCKVCNFAKHILTHEEFLNFIKRVYEKHLKPKEEKIEEDYFLTDISL